MNKYLWIYACVIVLFIGGLYYIGVKTASKYPSPEERLLRKIDSLTTKVDSIRRANDSIKIIIDTTEIKINHVHEEYIQIYDRIVNQSVDSDCVFFSRYLSKDSERYIDTINFEAVETY